MLSEHIAASISGSVKAPNTPAALRDAGIFLHEVQPLAGHRAIYKKSATAPNCLAVSAAHVFAAQDDKAVIHVYNREKGNLELIVPFQEKACSIALACADTVLVIGMESGKLILWETCTGRVVSTPSFHLQKVTSLAVSPDSNFLLSGSADSQVHVYSLPGLLSFHSTSDDLAPLHTLTGHRGPITSLAAGHSSSISNFAVSASKDSSVILWDYHTGTILRTYLLSSVPQSLVLDPADRGVYTCFVDGTLQLLDFYYSGPSHTPASTSTKNAKADTNHISAINSLHASTSAGKIYQPGASTLWTATSQDLSDALSLALSWDGSTLFSGHSSGKIVAWSTAKHSFTSVVVSLPGPVTNLQLLPPTGFAPLSPFTECQSKPLPNFAIQRIIKPRFDSPSSDGSSLIPENYSFTAQITIPSSRFKNQSVNDFNACLTAPLFSSDILSASLTDLTSSASEPRSTAPASNSASADFLSLDDGDGKGDKGMQDGGEGDEELRTQLRALQAIVKEQFKQLKDLRSENKVLAKREEEAEMRARRLLRRSSGSEAGALEEDAQMQD